MKLILFFLAFLLLPSSLLVSLVIPSFADPHVYRRTIPTLAQLQDTCQLQIQTWTREANLSFSSSSSPASNSTRFSGSYIRGRWNEFAQGGPIANTSVIEESEGRFDLVTRDDLDHSTSIVNISAVIYLMNRHSSTIALEAKGLLNSVSGEMCMVCCRSDMPIENWNGTQNSSATDCQIRATFTVAYANFRLLSTDVNGKIESLRPQNDSFYFSNLTIIGKMVRQTDQHVLFVSLIWFKFSLTLVEVLFIVIQIYHSIRKADVYFVSTLGLLVQLLVFGFNWVRAVYLPFTYLRKLNLRYLMRAWSWTLPIVSDFMVIMGYVILLGFVWNRKRKGKRVDKGEEEARELPMLLLGLPLYIVVGLILWWMKSFETYLRVLSYFWLLPQVVANAIWDIRRKPLSIAFMFGVTTCRLATLVYNTYRPTLYGYDDVYIFPKSWFWCMTLFLIAFLIIAFTQQAYGGRWFIPKRLYGYQQLEMTHHPNSFAKKEGGLYT